MFISKDLFKRFITGQKSKNPNLLLLLLFNKLQTKFEVIGRFILGTTHYKDTREEYVVTVNIKRTGKSDVEDYEFKFQPKDDGYEFINFAEYDNNLVAGSAATMIGSFFYVFNQQHVHIMRSL